jgi:hypothetical protein
VAARLAGCTFFIGGLALPPAPAQPVVTPLTLAGTTNLEDPSAVNITRLLLSLDADGDPSTGIQIPAGAADVAPASIDFDVPAETFAADQTVMDFVASAGGGDGTLATDAEAVAHLKQNVILGTYRSATEPGVTLVLFSDGRFVLAETAGEPGNGVDVGTYAYDPIGQTIAFTITYETNPDGGVGDGVGTRTVGSAVLDADGDLTLNGGHGDVVFVREPQGTGLAGTWRADDAHGFGVFVFFADGEFAYAEANGGSDGLEGGTYTYDAASHLITFTVTFSDNPYGGIYEEEGPVVSTLLAYDTTGLEIADTLTGTKPFHRQ